MSKKKKNQRQDSSVSGFLIQTLCYGFNFMLRIEWSILCAL